MKRHKTRKVRVGGICIGGDAPVSIQGMTKVRTSDVKSVVRQAKRMIAEGAELIRVAVLDRQDAKAIKCIKEAIPAPVIADIHYDSRLAMLAIRGGADKVRINPGNISARDTGEIAKAAGDRGIPLRLGINSGSVQRKGSLHESMVAAALDSIKRLQDMDFHSIVLSLKTPDVQDTVACYRRVSEACDYPLHLGITEAGRGELAKSKSVLGIGILLFEGIGDTLRVSLTEPPWKEIRAGRAILQSLGLRRFEPEIISCPGCGRIQVDLASVLKRVEKEMCLLGRRYPGLKELKIAVMGCGVNGPGEARMADIGIAGGRGKFALFKKGRIIGTYPEASIVEKLVSETAGMLEEICAG